MADFGLNLPTLDGLSASASEALNAVQDFSTASFSKLKAEAISCLKDTGQLGKFSKITPDLKVVQMGDMMGVTSSTTSALTSAANFVPVIKNPTGGVPSNIFEDWKDRTEEFKVTLTQEPNYGDDFVVVTFTVQPTIAESHSAQYDNFSPLHHPGSILKYKGTDSRTWGISAKLISRTPEEASINQNMLNTIRSWTMPFYGTGTAKSEKLLLGAPPPILTLKAYGDKMIGPVKCVLKTYNWDFPNDVDYIQTAEKIPTPFPVIISISLQLEESWSPAEYSGFDIVEYRRGNMGDAFRAIQASEPPSEQIQSADAANVNTSEATVVGAGGGRGSVNGTMQDYIDHASNASTKLKTKAEIYGSSPMGGHKGGAGGIK